MLCDKFRIRAVILCIHFLMNVKNEHVYRLPPMLLTSLGQIQMFFPRGGKTRELGKSCFGLLAAILPSTNPFGLLLFPTDHAIKRELIHNIVILGVDAEYYRCKRFTFTTSKMTKNIFIRSLNNFAYANCRFRPYANCRF